MTDGKIEKRMLEFISNCDDPEKLRQIAQNAGEQGVSEVHRAAKLKLFEVLPAEKPGTLEYEVWKAIHALEDALSEERGKTIRLARTRQKIQRENELICVRDLAGGKETEGFNMLADRDMLHLSFEAVALRYPDKFDDKILETSRKRLIEAGYDPSERS